MEIKTSGLSDVGRVRRSNEDTFGIFPELNLYVVADGMGGHAAGEVASKMAVDEMQAYFQNQPGNQSPEVQLKSAIAFANQQIHAAGSEDRSKAGMGTTVVSVLATPEESVIGYVGDSRLYLIQGGTIEQLTEDHSMVNEYVLKGMLTAEAAETHPQKHVLSRAMGTGPSVKIDVFSRKPVVGDTYLLCSDGLSNKVPAAKMLSIFQSAPDLDLAAKELISSALQAGGEDNITVILLSHLA